MKRNLRAQFFFIISAAIAVMIFYIISGCSIEESTGPETGAVFVFTSDPLGNELPGAEITIDNVPRSEITPDTLFGLSAGQHDLKVDYPGYYPLDTLIEVFDNQISEIYLVLEPALFGSLIVESAPPGAMVIIDRKHDYINITPVTVSQLETGFHAVSAFIDGWLTLPPEIDTVEITWQGESSVQFTLEQGTLGSQTGNTAPDFTLEDDFGSMVGLHNYRGSVVLLTFFFSTCPPCMEEFPEIDQIYVDYSPQGLMVLGLDPMFNDDLEDVQGVRNQLNIHFKLLLDNDHSVNYPLYNILAYPTNILIEPSGLIHGRYGTVSYETLAAEIENIMGN